MTLAPDTLGRVTPIETRPNGKATKASAPIATSAETPIDAPAIDALRTALERADVDAASSAIGSIADVIEAPIAKRARAEAIIRRAAARIEVIESGPYEARIEAIDSIYDALDAARRLRDHGSLDLAAIMSERPRDLPWICRALHIGPTRPAMLLGYPGAGKTYAMVSAAAAWSIGRSAWGCPDFRAQRTPRVLYVDTDQGHAAALPRAQWTFRAFGLTEAEIRDSRDMFILSREGKSSLCLYGSDKHDITAFRRAWARAVRGFDLVIVDSYRGMLLPSGIDENKAQAGVIGAELTRITEDTGVTFWLCRHSGKDPTAKGTTTTPQTGSGSAAIDGNSGAKIVMDLDPKVTDKTAALVAPRRVYMERSSGLPDAPHYEPHYLALEIDKAEQTARCAYRTTEQLHPPTDHHPERDAAVLASDAITILRHAAQLTTRGQRMGGVESARALIKSRRDRAGDVLQHMHSQGWISTAKGPFFVTDEGKAYIATLAAEGRR